jgi:hypothetical protein
MKKISILIKYFHLDEPFRPECGCGEEGFDSIGCHAGRDLGGCSSYEKCKNEIETRKALKELEEEKEDYGMCIHCKELIPLSKVVPIEKTKDYICLDCIEKMKV